jgi:hypothetical protein
LSKLLLADLVVLIHLAFVIFAVLGALLIFKWRWIILLHLPAAFWAIYIEISGGICPLTPLENSLRSNSGESAYSGGFIEYYVLPVLYPSGLTKDVQLLLGITLLMINMIIYWLFFRQARR